MDFSKIPTETLISLFLDGLISILEWVFIVKEPFLNILLIFFQYIALQVFFERYMVLSRIEEYMKREKEIFFNREDPPTLSKRIEKAKESLSILAISYGRLIGIDRLAIERKYNEGCKIKILVVDPVKSGDIALMGGYADEKTVRNQIETTIRFLQKYKGVMSDNEGTIEGRLLSAYPGFGLFITNDETHNGEIKIELILRKEIPDKWPNLLLTKQDGERYQQFISHFNKMWTISKQIENEV